MLSLCIALPHRQQRFVHCTGTPPTENAKSFKTLNTKRLAAALLPLAAALPCLGISTRAWLLQQRTQFGCQQPQANTQALRAHARTHTHTRTHTSTKTKTCARRRTRAHKRERAQPRTRTRTHPHAHTHTRTHTHTHARVAIRTKNHAHARPHARALMRLNMHKGAQPSPVNALHSLRQTSLRSAGPVNDELHCTKNNV